MWCGMRILELAKRAVGLERVGHVSSADWAKVVVAQTASKANGKRQTLSAGADGYMVSRNTMGVLVNAGTHFSDRSRVLLVR